MTRVAITTQTELDAAIGAAIAGDTIIVQSRDAQILSVRTRKNIVIEARGSAHVEARESAHVEAWESAHVEAWGSVQVRAYNDVVVTAQSQYVVVTQDATAQITGPATVVVVPPIRTAADWIAYYGAQACDAMSDSVVLYKAVRDDYRSAHGFLYQPGSVPQAPDWDGGTAECGGGLHFCATPSACLAFDRIATRFMACPVRIADIVVHDDPVYPFKIKATGLCAPCWEVDRRGNRREVTHG